MLRSGYKIITTIFLLMSIISCSDSTTVEEYLAQAEQFTAKKDYNSAIIALKNAVRLDINNSNVRFKLAASYLEQGDYLSAEKEFEKAEQLGASNEFLYAKLAETKVKLYKIDEVYPLVDKAINASDDELVVVLTYAGIAALHEENSEKAKDFIDRAIGISENSAYGQLGRVYLSYSDADSYSQGLATVDELLVNNPNFTEALLLKGYLQQNSQQFEQAAKTFKQYSKLRPKEVQIHFLIAQNYVSAQKFDLAEPEVDFLLKVSERNPVANQQKAQIAFSREDYQNAKEHAVVAIQQNDNLTLSRIIAGVSSYKLADYEQAYQHLITIKDKVAANNMVSKLLIDLQLRLGYDADALSTLRSQQGMSEADASLLTSASYQFLKSGDVEAAQELLAMSIELNSQNPEEIAKQGILQLKLNQTGEGLKILEQALKLDPESSIAEQGLAVGYLADNQDEKALEIAKKWQADGDKAAHGYILESTIRHKEQRFDEAKALLEKAIELDVVNVAALYKLALYAHQDKDKNLAYQYYTRAIKRQPQHTGAVRNFIRLLAGNKDLTTTAIKFYQAEIQQKPENNHLKLALAYIHRVNNEHQLSVDLFKQILASTEPLTGSEIALADSYRLLGQWDMAIENYRKFYLDNPENLTAAHRLFSAYEQTKQIDKALELVEKALNYHQENNGLVLLKTYYQSLLRVEASTADLETLQSDEATQQHWLLDNIQGNLAYNIKDFSAASRHYQNAYAKQASAANAINWSKVEGLRGDIHKATEILQQHLKLEPESIATKVMLAGAYLKSEQTIQAIGLYKEILSLDAKNIIALNNLAFLELENNNATQALNYAEQAVKLAPNNAGVLDTYAQALVANQKIESAIAEYDKALSYAKGNAEISIHKAQALIASNQYGPAKETLLSVTNMTNKEKAQIKALLAKIDQG